MLSIWHGAVRAANRERYAALAESSDLELTVLAPRRWSAALPRPLDFERGDDRDYRVIVASARLRRHAAFHIYPRLFSILSAVRPDLIDFYEEPYTLIALLIAWWRNQFSPGCRLVFTACQNIAKRYPVPFRQMERYVLRSADGAMGLNRGAVEVFRAKGYEGPFEAVPTGIDPARLRRVEVGDLRERLGLNRTTVGYVGRLVEEKGVATLLEAAAFEEARGERPEARGEKQEERGEKQEERGERPEARGEREEARGKRREEGGDYQVLIVGDGPEKAALRQRAEELGIADRVVWVDSVASSEVARYLSCMDVLVLPSRTRSHWKEQLGRVLIEAMACEVAVVGSRSGAIPDVIGDAGLLFEEGDAAGLSAALDRVLGDADFRRDLTMRGRRRAEGEFSWASIAQRIRSVWQQALDRPPLEIRQRMG
ncbi:hypothetical protein AMJ85_09440 [candidate division BRC1 bacterium SM23_51]|nr:MAG: hypothetical protein AMJ85_09440 [candidate division BRC1 bacterium SM23_51]